MNEHLRSAVPRTAAGSTRPNFGFERFLGDPNGADRVREEAQTRFRRDNPRIEDVGRERKIIEMNLEHREDELKRHFSAKAGTDLTRPRLGDAHEGSAGSFERSQFAFLCLASVAGVAVGWYSLARYVEGSGIIPALEGNLLGAALVSAAPLTGSFGFKVIGDLLPSDKLKRRFFIALTSFGSIALSAHLIAMSATFGPTRIDISAISDQLMSGGMPAHPSGGLTDFAPIFVLGSGLLAETLLAPAFMWVAAKMSQARRKLIVPIHEAQIAHDTAIDAITERIRHLNQQHADLVAEEADLSLREDAEVAKSMEEFGLLDAAFRREWARSINKFRAKREGMKS